MEELKLTLAFKKINKESTWMAKVISLWTRSQYHHVELIVNNKWISSDSDTGVVIKDLQPLKDNWEYIELPNINICREHYNKFNTYIYKVNGSGYDWKGIILSQTIPLSMNNSDKWFCSELVTKLLHILLIEESLDLEPNEVSPKDLYNTFKHYIKN